MARSRLQRSGSSLKQIRYYNNNDNKISRFCSFLTMPMVKNKKHDYKWIILNKVHKNNIISGMELSDQIISFVDRIEELNDIYSESHNLYKYLDDALKEHKELTHVQYLK